MRGTNHTNPFIFGGVGGGNGNGIIRGTIVPDNDLKFSVGLRQDTIKRVWEIHSTVINGDDEGDEGWHKGKGRVGVLYLECPGISQPTTKKAEQQAFSSPRRSLA